MPATLEVTPLSDDGLVMGVKHKKAPLWRVQFHPESISTEHGHRLLANFLEMAGASDARLSGRPSRPAVPPAAAGGRAPARSPFRVLSRRIAGFVDSESAFDRLFAASPEAFWLDSARVIEGYSRYSFMGDASGPHAKVLLYDLDGNRLFRRFGDRAESLTCSIFDYLRNRLDRLAVADPGPPFDFCDGWVGFLGYELKALCGAARAHAATDLDAGLLFSDRFIAFDHAVCDAWLVHLARPGDEAAAARWMDTVEAELAQVAPLDPPAPAPNGCRAVFQARHDRAAYIDRIRRAKSEIRSGESYEVCLTNEIWSAARPDPATLYRILRDLNPAPYGAFLKMPGATILSSSPERFLRIDRDGRIDAKPIKGTAPRSELRPLPQPCRPALRPAQ